MNEAEINTNSCQKSSTENLMEPLMDHRRARYPFCIVWTPLPLLTWIFPFIGHMGIAMSSGVIRDFAGPYFVSEDNMAFGKPTKYWRLRPELAAGGTSGWDRAVIDASEEYKSRMHNLCCDNCHSHVAMALNLMKYDGSEKWNMVKLAFYILFKGHYVSFAALLKTWAPFIIIVTVVSVVYVFTRNL
ncbi:transmembrane protein 222 [Schistocerca americana]|uniref:transmembrane protein 222 n=1 Tax=Schistocerca americana TaxID=7009 RepID=UPI001F50294C|nr:transmembrane protein 222 [Schistocerca americana]